MSQEMKDILEIFGTSGEIPEHSRGFIEGYATAITQMNHQTQEAPADDSAAGK